MVYQTRLRRDHWKVFLSWDFCTSLAQLYMQLEFPKGKLLPIWRFFTWNQTIFRENILYLIFYFQCLLCSRSFQNVKLRVDFVEIWSFYSHSYFTWNQILVNSNGPKMLFLPILEALNFGFLVILRNFQVPNLPNFKVYRL